MEKENFLWGSKNTQKKEKIKKEGASANHRGREKG